jgi:hypothetical protein
VKHAPLPSPAAPTLRDVVRECIEAAADQQDATDRLLERVRADAALRSELLTPWETTAAAAIVVSVQAAQRRTIWVRPSAPDARVSALRTAAATMLMDFPLPGGKRVRDATAADLAAGVAFYAGRAADMGAKARWLAAVRAKLEATNLATVAEAMDEAALAALREDQADA